MNKNIIRYNTNMQKYKSDLANFINDIETNNITVNEIIVGKIDEKVIEFLKTKNIFLETSDIYFSVKAFHHIQRDFKKKLGKTISKDMVNEIYKSLNNPYKILFDNQKEKLNLIYIDKDKNILFKIVIQPNYKSKLGLINYILTAGIIQEADIKLNYYDYI